MASGKTAVKRSAAAQEPVEGLSDITLVGQVTREAQKPNQGGDATPFSFLTVMTEEVRAEEARPERIYHDVVGFGDVAKHLARSFENDDVVRVTGRLGYRAGRTAEDPRTHRIVVRVAADIGGVSKDSAHVTEVSLTGTVSTVQAGEAKKSRVPYLKMTLICVIPRDDQDGTVEIEHRVLAFDRAAVAAGDLGLAKGDTVLVKGRLVRSPVDRDRTAYEPTVLIDDLSGSIEKSV